MRTSILERVRQETEQRMLNRHRLDRAQISLMERDEIAYQAKTEAYAEAPRRYVWFLLGMSSAFIAMAIFHSV